MNKIFILTGEPSGDKLASKVIRNLQKINTKVEYLCVGGENLSSLGIKSIYKLEEITYLGFTKNKHSTDIPSLTFPTCFTKANPRPFFSGIDDDVLLFRLYSLFLSQLSDRLDNF